MGKAAGDPLCSEAEGESAVRQGGAPRFGTGTSQPQPHPQRREQVTWEAHISGKTEKLVGVQVSFLSAGHSEEELRIWGQKRKRLG